ncbi:MAG: hypothetical protein LH609_23700, partial [Rudanella sp.]|nr:hypothetical protein [Rudanella sp.]
ALSQRPAINPVSGSPSSSTLSGDIDNSPASTTGNSLHVISNPAGLSLTTSAVLDGFVITGGNANEGNTFGGGMYNDGRGSGKVCSPSPPSRSFSTTPA